MVRPDGYVKVLDFGIAKLTDNFPEQPSSDLNATTVALVNTQPGMVIGTPHYMSPEQVRGLKVDARSDIFSLGVVVYEMATGKRPFEGATTADLLVSILQKEPLPLAHYLADDPAELNVILAKSLEKDRERRYQSAHEFLADLRNLTSGELKEPSIRTNLPSIVVLPFVNMSADPENDYFCDGLAEDLINVLTTIQDLRVVSRTSAFSFKGKSIDIREIGQKLNASSILEGSVRKVENRLRITAQLINVADGYHLWSARYDRDMGDIFDIQDEISLAIVDTLRIKALSEQKVALVKRYTDNLEAYHLYLKGRYFWNHRDKGLVQKAIECFQQAIAKDPCYALAYAGVADCFSILGACCFLPPKQAFSIAESAVEKALTIDSGLAEAHASLGLIRMGFHWDWAGAEQAYKKAVELNPNYAFGHSMYGMFLSGMGRSEEAISESMRALELDPLSIASSVGVGHTYYLARQYDRAIVEYEKALDLDPNSLEALAYIATAYAQKSLYDKALAALQKATALSGRSTYWLGFLGLVYGEAGRHEDAENVLKELHDRSEREYVAPLCFALTYLGLGDRDRTFEWIDKAYEDHNVNLFVLKADPVCDSIRSDPRYDNLLARMRLTEVTISSS